MNESDILAAFHARRKHYDTYLAANDVPAATCPGCGFPTLAGRNNFDVCAVCAWEDDGQDDGSGSMLDELRASGIRISGPNGQRSLHENRINIGRMLEVNAALVDGETDTDVARVLSTIAHFRQRKQEIADKMSGDEHPNDHIWMEWLEVGKDLLMALVVPKPG